MIMLNRSEKFASQAGYFSEMQFGFQECSGCIEASFTILETINHMLERGEVSSFYFGSAWEFHNCSHVPFDI